MKSTIKYDANIPSMNDRILGAILVWAEHWMDGNGLTTTLRPGDLAGRLNAHSKRARWEYSFTASSVSRWINNLLRTSTEDVFEGIQITRETGREPKRNGDGTQTCTRFVFTKLGDPETAEVE